MTLHALPVIALQTQFGRWLLLRGILLLGVLPMLRPWRTGITLATVMAAIRINSRSVVVKSQHSRMPAIED